MIKLPVLTEQVMYDAETVFCLSMTEERLAKFVIHWELMKLARYCPGVIVECGVFKGTSLSRFALMRSLLGCNFSAKIIGFDVFSNDFPDTSFIQDKDQRQFWIETAGSSSIGKEQLYEILNKKGLTNVELIDGDASVTVPQYFAKNEGLRVSLLNVDIDFVEPTIVALETIYPLITKGGIVILDNYSGEGGGGSYYGDTHGAEEALKKLGINPELKRFPFAARPVYFIKN